MATQWLLVCISLVTQWLVSISLATSIIANTTNEHLNSVLSCDDEATCTIKCSGYRSCMASIIKCNNSSQCLIHCEGLESCTFSAVYQSPSNNVEITCTHKRSCLFMNVYQDTSNLQITSNSTFTLHATEPDAAKHLNLHDTLSHSTYNLYCNGTASCDSLAIHFNPNVSTIALDDDVDYIMNIVCNGIESCKDLNAETSDNWYNTINDNNIVYNTLNVSVYCMNILSCEDATFDFSNLLANGFGSERQASDFGDVRLFCGDGSSISACDHLKVTCPDLVPFNAYYDYLYQQENIKCHVSMLSYSEIVTVVSKHGANMVDIECDSSDTEICDEVVLFCSEVDIKCTMNYDAVNAVWICDDLDEYYTFPANEYAVYGCAAFVWFSDTAIIKTSEIPDYSIYTHDYIWCLTYNPAMTAQCIINCDTDYGCFESTLDCADSTQCIVNCNAKEACGADFSSSDWTYIFCPYNWPSSVTYIAPARACDIIAHPELDHSSYGSFFTELQIRTYANNVVSIDHDPTISWFIYDYGMTSLDVTIADYPEVANFSVYDDYFVDNWYRVHNMYTSYDAVTFTISCTFCYNVWLIFNGYWDKAGSKSYISCHENCMDSQIDIYGVSETYVYCAFTEQSNCNGADISVIDGYLYTECYVNCDDLNIYNNPYKHYDYSVLYNVYVYSYEYYLYDKINIYSLYGFDHVTVAYHWYYYWLASLTPLSLIQGYCGYPNYYKDCGSYPYLNNASCNFTECSATHPRYDTIALATVPFQYNAVTITSLLTVCRAYEACWNIDIQCGIPANATAPSGRRNDGRRKCLVECHERFACYGSTIYANEYELTLDCSGYRSCENTKIYGSISTTDIEINCLNALACYNMYINHSLATYIEDGAGLKVTCYDLNEVLDIVSYRSTSCVNVDIYCPATPTAEQLVNTNDAIDASSIKDPKCHLIMQNNIIAGANIVVRNEMNGVEFFNITCEYNNVTQTSACSDVMYFCDADDTMSSKWYYDTNSGEHMCNGSCCDFINSQAPTSSPTAAPTRAPTIWRYDVFFDAVYQIIMSFESSVDLLSFEDEFYNHSFSDSLQENEHFSDAMQDALQVAYFKSDTTPSFADFHVNVTNITSLDNDEDEDDDDDERRRILTARSNDSVSVGFDIFARISSINSTIDRFLAITRYSDSFDFDSNLIDYLVEQFPLIASINFSVISVNYEIPTDEEEEEGFSISNGTFLSIGVTGTLFIMALCGFLYAKKLLCFKNTPDCDDTTYLDVMSYGMQIFDLYTDITFSLELHAKYQELQETNTEDPKLYLIEFLWIFSLVFIILPYIMNLILAITFQSESVTRFGSALSLNFYTRTWFVQYNRLFCLFVMLCGSVFASLLLVNCKLFGLTVFHAGISAVEIESIDKLKIYYITLLENVPQLVIQVVYVVKFGKEAITVTFVASTISSIFNITLSVMSFLAKQTSQARIDVDGMTRLCIEIVSKDAELERADGNDEVIPKEVQVLHRREGRRLELTQNVTVTLNRLAGNFEFLYSVRSAKGIQLYGICVSDSPSSLKKQIAKYEKKLISVVKSTFSLEKVMRWDVLFEVISKDGNTTPSKEDPKEAEGAEGASGGTEEKTTLVGTTDKQAVFSDSEYLDTKEQTTDEVEMQPTTTERELMDVLSDDDINEIHDMLKDVMDDD